jgi:hypothetical protein
MRRRAGAIWCTFKPSTDDAVGSRDWQILVESGMAASGDEAHVTAVR